MPAAVDVLVVGGGAAGLMCAIEAGKRGRRVVVLEHNPQIGRKILISGGGRCNFTNLYTRPENYISANPHFAKSALARYHPQDFLDLVRQHRIPYHEKTLGQLFCDQSARDITGMLETECAAAGVRIETGCAVRQVERANPFRLVTTLGGFETESLVVATGGLSVPKVGATSFGYDLARQFGLAVRPCRPALVPLTLPPEALQQFGELAGVSLPVEIRAGGVTFAEKMLFTHRGLSGPAILQASSYWEPGTELEIDLVPDIDVAARLQERRADLRAVLSSLFPQRFAARWPLPHTGGPLGDRAIQTIADGLHHWRVRPAGTEGFAKAEVTAGGVDTAELSSQTFEAKKVPGLFLIGEVLDVTGQLGGFNFQWAWASGFAAGQVV
ncbi:MAG TPA: NAD(P)/FAD-dependent oxidoreductase [Bryobacteraceae bacterium]|nr:NAD(P)/FAD-dependent oxidoreductase [Bryobacteraceae bacterium]